jgi:hypothetical protein
LRENGRCNPVNGYKQSFRQALCRHRCREAT